VRSSIAALFRSASSASLRFKLGPKPLRCANSLNRPADVVVRKRNPARARRKILDSIILDEQETIAVCQERNVALIVKKNESFG
jgi:hypothetical protein